MNNLHQKCKSFTTFKTTLLPCLVETVFDALKLERNVQESEENKTRRCLSALKPSGLVYCVGFLQTRTNMSISVDIRERVQSLDFIR